MARCGLPQFGEVLMDAEADDCGLNTGIGSRVVTLEPFVLLAECQ